MPRFYKDFGKHVDNIYAGLNSPQLVDIAPGVRAHSLEDETIYAGEIHTHCLGERPKEQTKATDKFRHAHAHDIIYMGIAGFLNFTHIVDTKPSAVILFDVNFLQQLFWEFVIEGLKTCTTPEEFLDQYLYDADQALKERIMKLNTNKMITFNSSGYLGNKAQLHEIIDRWELFRTGMISWRDRGDIDLNWHNEDGFHYLKQLALNGSITAITLDVMDEHAIEQLRDGLNHITYEVVDENGNPCHPMAFAGARINYLYISNVLHFLDKRKTDWTGRANAGQTKKIKACSNLSRLFPPQGEDICIIDEKGEIKAHIFPHIPEHA